MDKIACVTIFHHWANRFSYFIFLFTDIFGRRVILSNLYFEYGTWRWISFWEWEIVVTPTDDSWLSTAEKQPRLFFPLKDGPSPSKQHSPHMNVCHLSVSVHALLLRRCERSSRASMSLCGSAFAQCFKACVSFSMVLKGSEGFQSFRGLETVFLIILFYQILFFAQICTYDV